MPKASEPTADELREIGRRLCKCLGLKPAEPVSALKLQRVADDALSQSLGIETPPRRHALLYAIRACADALGNAEDELPDEIKEFRFAVEQWAHWLEKGVDHLNRLREATERAIAPLDSLAREREQALRAARTEVERERLSNAPSSQMLCQLPRLLARSHAEQEESVFRCRKMLNSLTAPNAHATVQVRHGPIRTRIQKALESVGFTRAEVTTITEPGRKPGRGRRKGRDAARKRTTSKAADVYSYTVVDHPKVIARTESAVAAMGPLPTAPSRSRRSK